MRVSSKELFSHLMGKKIFVRTVTFHHVGRLKESLDGAIILENATWVADSGRWNEALTTGYLYECEPFPDDVMILVSSIVDITEWCHELPTAPR